MIAPIAYAATFLSSACFGLASVFEQLGTQHIKPIETINPLAFIPLLKQTPYIAGLILDGLGFGLFLVAVHALPLFFVLAVDTASIAVTALASRYMMNVSLTFKTYKLMALLLVGLSLLAYAAAPEVAAPVSNSFRWGVLSAAIVLGAASIILSGRLNKQPLLTAFMSGVCFSGVGIAGRLMPGGLRVSAAISNPLLFAIILFGVLGILLFSIALQSDSITHVYAINFVTETVIATSIGLCFLGDSARNGMWIVMLAGLVITVASTVVLALTKAPYLGFQK